MILCLVIGLIASHISFYFFGKPVAIREMSLKLSILHAIEKLEEPYGVSIRKYVSEDLNIFLDYGTLYITLDKMEKEGLIYSFPMPGGVERSFRDKRVYRLGKSSNNVAEV